MKIVSSLNKTFFRAAAALAGIAFVLTIAACKQAPTPPYHGEDAGTSAGVEYASFYWKEEADFKRISEYFTDKENTGSNVVVRTDNEVRSGLYLVLNLDSGSVIPEGSVAELRYFHPKKSGKQIVRWTLPEFNAAWHRELQLGLTGNDWGSALSKKRPSAWQITIVAPDKTLLVRRNSYLWTEQ